MAQGHSIGGDGRSLGCVVAGGLRRRSVGGLRGRRGVRGSRRRSILNLLLHCRCPHLRRLFRAAGRRTAAEADPAGDVVRSAAGGAEDDFVGFVEGAAAFIAGGVYVGLHRGRPP